MCLPAVTLLLSLSGPLCLKGAVIGTGLVPISELPLRTQGPYVVSALTGKRKTLSCVNWYGAHMDMLVNNGLNARPLMEIAATIVELGFNCVRLPYSLDMVFTNSTVPDASRALAHDQELQALSPLQVFDATVERLTDAGLMVIINNHVSKGGWCCDEDDGEGLWYTKEYPESVWLDSISKMAARYRHNPKVVGFDIRNEIREATGVKPTWGDGQEDTDWALAAWRGAQRALASNSELLVILSGLSYSMFLCGVPEKPLHMDPLLRYHVVYTSHEYDWYLDDIQHMQKASFWLCSAHLVLVSSACTLMCLRACLPARWQQSNAARRNCVRIRRCSRPFWRSASRPVSLVKLNLVATASTAAFLFVLACNKYWLSCSSYSPKGAATFLLALLLWLIAVVTGMMVPFRMGSGTTVWLGLKQAQSPASLPNTIGRQDLEKERNSYSPTFINVEVQSPAEPGSPSFSPQELVEAPRRRFPGVQLAALVLSAISMAGSATFTVWVSSYEAFADALDMRWGFLQGLAKGQAVYSDELAEVAPVWLGEFGTNRESQWWKHMVRYLAERPLAGWAYWPLNGEKRPGVEETYGLLLEDMRSVRHPWKLKALQELAVAASR
eukprot:TRINITY_DN113671_c0_g1_i1.p1 TRINITY_DN113671_c0_g1~~TRINITY_DN113671_c0_g1_i1.p1  ORF type:complete len:626 (-),score=77.98 TRINITY_DN113671_c0_g1_i1:94-1926(-)